jgi:hypothetical protein
MGVFEAEVIISLANCEANNESDEACCQIWCLLLSRLHQLQCIEYCDSRCDSWNETVDLLALQSVFCAEKIQLIILEC